MSIVLDLFAGPGGWDEGVRHLGIRPLGLEWDADACATGMAAGHWRLQTDVAAMRTEWLADLRDVAGLIASPPCQGFSMAGKGRGRADTVHLLESLQRVRTVEDLDADLAELHATMADDRSTLALQPLRYALATRPGWLAWEQVPAVLPLWEACADVLRAAGYSAATGLLSAEQYGVPQTRQRAILVARSPELTARLGPAALPAPTHSRYYPRTPDKLDDGLQPWVSMADALGWDSADLMGFPRRSDGRESVELDGVEYRARDLHPASRPAPALTEKARSWQHMVMHAAGRTSPQTAGTVPRDPFAAPSATITGKGTAAWEYVGGTHGKATRRTVDLPAPTIMYGERLNTVQWQLATGTRPNATRRQCSQPAPALAFGNDAASHVIVPTGTTPDEVVDAKLNGARRVSVQEAAVLQTFPADYPWQGSRTAQYRQVGDAVPPLLALHVVAAVLGVQLAVQDAA